MRTDSTRRRRIHRSRSRGLTLVELLAVLVIIGVLVALLLPAIQRARESGRRAACINNMRRVAAAVLQHEQNQGAFPGYNNLQAVNKSAESPVGYVTGWVFELLPLLERPDLFEHYGPHGELAARNVFLPPTESLDVVVCPSDFVAQQSALGAAMSYVVNAGMADRFINGGPEVPYDWPSNGVFHSDVPYLPITRIEVTDPSGAGPPREIGAVGMGPEAQRQALTKMTLAFITRADGATTTLLLSENVDSGRWTDWDEARVGFVWQAGLDSNGNPAPGKQAGDKFTLFAINDQAGEADRSPDSVDYRFARPASFHPGGVVAAFCDGRVTFLDERIEYLTYCQLMTPAGQHCLPSGYLGIDRGRKTYFRDHETFAAYARGRLGEGALDLK